MRPKGIRIFAFAAIAALSLTVRVIAQQPAASPPSSSSEPAPPQQTNPEPGASEGANARAIPVPSTAGSPEVSNPELRPVIGELVNKLDTRSAKAGDVIMVRTTEKATTANGIEIPKGSKIVGRITDVEPKGQDGENSRVTIQFDEAELKGGQNLHIRSVIQSVAPPGDIPADAAGGRPSPAPPRETGAVSSSAQVPGPAPGSTSSGTPAAGTVVSRNANEAIRATAIPGVFLAGNANGQPFPNAAGALVGAKQDVRLNGGTTVVVAIMTAPVPVGR